MTETQRVTEPLDVKLDYLTFKIDVINERAKELASRIYEQEFDLSLRELRLMRCIGTQPGLTVTQLVEQTHLEKTLTSKALAALVRRKLLVRSIDPRDARQTNLYLTPAGAHRVKAADAIGQRMERGMLSDLSDSDLDVFRRVLDTLYERQQDTGQALQGYLRPLVNPFDFTG